MKKNKGSKKSDLTNFFIYILAVLSLWLTSKFILDLIYEPASNRGEFGDSYGALNALFSGLAFAGIIFTIQLQRKELRLQRKELKMTRKELKRSAQAQEKTEEVLREQMKLHKKETSYNYIDSMLKNTMNTIKLNKNDISPNNPLPEYLDIIVRNYINEKNKVYIKVVEITSLKMFTFINQMTYILEEINISFSEDRKAKFFWTMQLNDCLEEIKFREVFKIKERIDSYTKKNEPLPFELKLKDLLAVSNTLEARVRANYLEFDKTR